MSFLQRLLLNLDKLHGLIWLPLGLLGLYCLRQAPHYTYEIGSIIFFTYVALEGARKLLSDPVKQAITLDLAKAEHWAASELGYDPTDVTAPVQPDQAPSPPPAAKAP